MQTPPPFYSGLPLLPNTPCSVLDTQLALRKQTANVPALAVDSSVDVLYSSENLGTFPEIH